MRVTVLILLVLTACGGSAGALDGHYDAALLQNGAVVPCYSGAVAVGLLAGPMVLHEDPPGVISGNVTICTELHAVIGSFAHGEFDLVIEDLNISLTRGKLVQGDLQALAEGPGASYDFRATRR